MKHETLHDQVLQKLVPMSRQNLFITYNNDSRLHNNNNNNAGIIKEDRGDRNKCCIVMFNWIWPFHWNKTPENVSDAHTNHTSGFRSINYSFAGNNVFYLQCLVNSLNCNQRYSEGYFSLANFPAKEVIDCYSNNRRVFLNIFDLIVDRLISETFSFKNDARGPQLVLELYVKFSIR